MQRLVLVLLLLLLLLLLMLLSALCGPCGRACRGARVASRREAAPAATLWSSWQQACRPLMHSPTLHGAAPARPVAASSARLPAAASTTLNRSCVPAGRLLEGQLQAPESSVPVSMICTAPGGRRSDSVDASSTPARPAPTTITEGIVATASSTPSRALICGAHPGAHPSALGAACYTAPPRLRTRLSRRRWGLHTTQHLPSCDWGLGRRRWGPPATQHLPGCAWGWAVVAGARRPRSTSPAATGARPGAGTHAHPGLDHWRHRQPSWCGRGAAGAASDHHRGGRSLS